MTLDKIKKAMLDYRDYYGFDLSNTDKIEAAKTKEELAEILNRYEHRIEDMALDATNHLRKFKRKIGL